MLSEIGNFIDVMKGFLRRIILLGDSFAGGLLVNTRRGVDFCLGIGFVLLFIVVGCGGE